MLSLISQNTYLLSDGVQIYNFSTGIFVFQVSFNCLESINNNEILYSSLMYSFDYYCTYFETYAWWDTEILEIGI